MTQQAHEFELKVTLTQDDVERLVANPQLRGRKSVKRTLHSVYYDTPDHRLRDEGLTLRVRSDGEQFVQTVKTASGVNLGLSNPVEIEDQVDGGQPDVTCINDKRVRLMVQEAVSASALTPIFETVVTRTTYRLRRSGSVLEVSLDEGETRAEDRRSSICEAEIELISGDPGALLETAQALFSHTELHLSPESKAERGYRLILDVPPGKELTPIQARSPKLKRGQSCGEAFAEIFRVACDQIVANRTVVLETEEAEGAHQLRVGLTRLRSAQRALKRLIASPLLAELETDARAISHAVGKLRDADMMIEDIFAPVAGEAANSPEFAELYRALRAYRAQMQEAARQALTGEQWSRLLLNFTLWPPMLERDQTLQLPIEEYTAKALQRRWKKVAQCGRFLKSLDPEQKHKMRRSLKKLRYIVAFFAPLYPEKGVEQFEKKLKGLQDVLGYANDVRTADQLRQVCAVRSGDRTKSCFAAGYVLGYHQAKVARVWKDAAKDWRRLKASERFWQ
jgi:triphosphatase